MRREAAALLLVMACGDDGAGQPDDRCPGIACPAPPPNRPQGWMLEVIPPGGSEFVRTEFSESAVQFVSARPTTLTVPERFTIDGVIRRSNGAPGSVRVVVSIPSDIRGRVHFEGTGQAVLGTNDIRFEVPVPGGAIGNDKARLTVLPDEPLDGRMAPFTWALRELSKVLPVDAPDDAQSWVVDGLLQDPLGGPVTNYVAQAYYKGRLVSTVRRTGNASDAVGTTAGRFSILIPKTSADGINLADVELELASAFDLQLQDPDDPAGSPAPRLRVRGMVEGKTTLGVLKLPTDQQRVGLFEIPVQGPDGAPLVGAVVRFRATLAGAEGGTAYYVREAVTNETGHAFIQLIPGRPNAPREYAVAVIPPSGSSASPRCVPRYAVGVHTEGAPVGRLIELTAAKELIGTVVDASKMPLGGVVVTATRRPTGEVDPVCGFELLPRTSSVTSEADGTFQLWLEGGRPYRLQFRPAPGSTSPSMGTDVMITTATPRQFQLPAGFLVEGILRTPPRVGQVEGPAAVGFLVSAVEKLLDGRVEERGQALTGADGRFRMILPEKP